MTPTRDELTKLIINADWIDASFHDLGDGKYSIDGEIDIKALVDALLPLLSAARAEGHAVGVAEERERAAKEFAEVNAALEATNANIRSISALVGKLADKLELRAPPGEKGEG